MCLLHFQLEISPSSTVSWYLFPSSRCAWINFLSLSESTQECWNVGWWRRESENFRIWSCHTEHTVERASTIGRKANECGMGGWNKVKFPLYIGRKNIVGLGWKLLKFNLRCKLKYSTTWCTSGEEPKRERSEKHSKANGKSGSIKRRDDDESHHYTRLLLYFQMFKMDN